MSADADVEQDVDEQPATDSSDTTAPDRSELLARIETLEDENERLRNAVEAAQRRRYRRTAIGLLIVGLFALGGAFAFPSLRTVLIALGGTGIFGAVLTYFLTPERFVAASVGEQVYRTLADNEAAIVDDLDLRGDPLVIPTEGDAAPARLYVSVTDGDARPDSEALSEPFVTGDEPGISLAPTGVPLYESVIDAAGTLPEAPGDLAATVGDALVEQFELVDGVDTDVEPGRATLTVSGSAYGPVDRFDHPVASVLAATLAIELDEPVTVDVNDGGERGDWLVTCRWDDVETASNETA
jgi:hypothetical protein